MREWIVDQGGLQAIWQALAWSMALVGGDKAAHDAALREPVHAVLDLMFRPDGTQPDFLSSVCPSVFSALTLLFRDILPRVLASGNAHEWRMRELLVNVASVSLHLTGSQPQLKLQQAFIMAWPHLIGWLRQQHSIGVQHTWLIVRQLTQFTMLTFCLLPGPAWTTPVNRPCLIL